VAPDPSPRTDNSLNVHGLHQILTKFHFPPHAGAAFRGGHMGDRTTRFWVAVLLTGMDIAVFQHFLAWSGRLGLAWTGFEWFCSSASHCGRVQPQFYGSTSITTFGSSSMRGAALGR
jgi:hypothetical protein